MSAWDVYEDKMSTHGYDQRTSSYNHEYGRLNIKLPRNLSFTSTKIYPMSTGFNIDPESDDGFEERNIAIIDRDNLNEKMVISLPGEDIVLGSLIVWMGNHWLVTERDANKTMYTRCKIVQCNHVLRWIHNGEIIEQWCIVEDGTKYLTGELEDRSFIATRGDARIAIMIARNEHTVELSRANRFLVDDPDTPHKMSFLLTKPLKVGSTYNEEGVLKFVLQEVTATEDDNHELGIADYYKYFHRGNKDDDDDEQDSSTEDTTGSSTQTPSKKVWL